MCVPLQVESSGADGERESGGESGPPAPTVSRCVWQYMWGCHELFSVLLYSC